MKIDDVPQDEGSCYGDMKRLTYAVDQDGHYTGVQTIGWEAEIATTAVAIQEANTLIRAAWEDARAGRRSPLAYHLALARMQPGLLAAEARVWRWRVRRHLRPGGLDGLRPAILARYADVMGITVQQLITLPDEPELL